MGGGKVLYCELVGYTDVEPNCCSEWVELNCCRLNKWANMLWEVQNCCIFNRNGYNFVG